MGQGQRPLEGLKVGEMARLAAGPLAAMMVV